MHRTLSREGAAAGLLRGLVVLMFVAAALAGCKRDAAHGERPAVSGEAIQGKREAVQGFGLAAAYPDQKQGDSLALVLEFSRPLVGTQAFDDLLAVADAKGAPVKGSWVLDDKDPRLLRFPHVDASKTY
ncbi:MAG TPA: hypothetical protein VFG18_08195, partial [Xanthomonadaceae bacterium]|nr:hypothetical protein [Xanthomonadaceae bacterium]